MTAKTFQCAMCKYDVVGTRAVKKARKNGGCQWCVRHSTSPSPSPLRQHVTAPWHQQSQDSTAAVDQGRVGQANTASAVDDSRARRWLPGGSRSQRDDNTQGSGASDDNEAVDIAELKIEEKMALAQLNVVRQYPGAKAAAQVKEYEIQLKHIANRIRMAKPIKPRLQSLQRTEYAVKKKKEAAEEHVHKCQQACVTAYEAYEDAKDALVEIGEELCGVQHQIEQARLEQDDIAKSRAGAQVQGAADQLVASAMSIGSDPAQYLEQALSKAKQTAAGAPESPASTIRGGATPVGVATPTYVPAPVSPVAATIDLAAPVSPVNTAANTPVMQEVKVEDGTDEASAAEVSHAAAPPVELMPSWPPLPEGWEQYTAPTGQPYFFCVATRVSAWEHPTTGLQYTPAQARQVAHTGAQRIKHTRISEYDESIAEQKQADRAKEFKKTVTTEEAKAGRAEAANVLRASGRQATLEARRAAATAELDVNQAAATALPQSSADNDSIMAGNEPTAAVIHSDDEPEQLDKGEATDAVIQQQQQKVLSGAKQPFRSGASRMESPAVHPTSK